MNSARTFVLIHGAWHGGWVWRDVMRGLRERGHAVTAPTLTGLGERRHVGQDSADLTTHVDDVVAHIELEDLKAVTLVGWSYGGIVATGVLARLPHRLKSIVYLDAFVPDDGEALVDYLPPVAREDFDRHKAEGLPIPPRPLSFFGVTDPAIIAFVEPRVSPQPWRTFYQPVRALRSGPTIALSYIACTGWGTTPFTARLPEMEADPRIRTAALDADHHCMLTAPEATIAALVASPG
jgi:pimeloyl-ACP methyl ester carboxylesterase